VGGHDPYVGADIQYDAPVGDQAEKQQEIFLIFIAFEPVNGKDGKNEQIIPESKQVLQDIFYRSFHSMKIIINFPA
jgi:hypothetical protein